MPYALSYLNGTNVAPYFSPRIVLVKTVSLIFTISGGLTLGMEGPFVFIGGGVALFDSMGNPPVQEKPVKLRQVAAVGSGG